MALEGGVFSVFMLVCPAKPSYLSSPENPFVLLLHPLQKQHTKALGKAQQQELSIYSSTQPDVLMETTKAERRKKHNRKGTFSAQTQMGENFVV